MLRLGRITGAHGLKGALRFSPENPGSDALETIARVFLDTGIGGAGREYRVTSSTRLNASTIRLTLDGINDVDAAEALKGATVMVAIEDLPARAPGEFYYYEAIGCEVFVARGESRGEERIGAIEEVFSNGAHEVLVVRDGAREVLVPVIADVVKAFDLAARRVTIEPIPGLLD
ncbi:MAG TPA: ribosome maturation factor RimM [Candidatus Binataceae bacterium]